MTIRPERGGDRAAVRRVNEAAFERPGEADLVDALRAAGAATLSLVAEARGEIVGHILFSPVSVEGPGGTFPLVGLAPMAVLPAYQRLGVGTALVQRGLVELASAEHDAVVVLGHPAYYPRFGFVRATRAGLRWEHPCRDEAFLVRELRPGALAGRTGVVRYRPELDAV
jgi:putative acetyltransferase